MKLLSFLKRKAAVLKINITALSLAYKRPDVPLPAKIFAGLAVIYAFSPIDLIPDFIPILGYIDDLILLPLLIYLAVKLIPKDVMPQCKAEARELATNGKSKKWRYALPIIVIWIAVLAVVPVKLIG